MKPVFFFIPFLVAFFPGIDFFPEKMTAFTSAITFVSVIAACCSTWLAMRAARFQARSTYIRYYASPEMYKSLEILNKIKNRNLPAFQHSRTPENNDSWKPDSSIHSTIPDSIGLTAEEMEEIDFARRTVKFYFLELLKQHQKKCIDNEFFKDCINQSSIVLLFQIVEILESAINPEYSSKAFRELMNEIKNNKIEYSKFLSRKHHFHEKQLVYSKLLNKASIPQTYTVRVESPHRIPHHLTITLTK